MDTAAPTNKDKIERMVRESGLVPQDRRKVRDYDLLLADGFSLPPHRVWRRFGIDEGEFPRGCYVTFWWLMKGEDRLFVAVPLFFDVGHNPEYMDSETRRRARLNRAQQEAESFVKRLGKKQMGGRDRNLH